MQFVTVFAEVDSNKLHNIVSENKEELFHKNIFRS